jgi:hypothetical protein
MFSVIRGKNFGINNETHEIHEVTGHVLVSISVKEEINKKEKNLPLKFGQEFLRAGASNPS